MPIHIMKKFNVILATDLDGGIGLNGKLPWKFSLDYNFFKSIIQSNSILPGIIQTDNILIVGHKTWKSINYNLFPTCKFYVISSQWNELSQINNIPQIIFYPTFFSAYLNASKFIDSDIWVIGGAQIYNEALRHWACNKVYWTKIYGHFKSDTTIQVSKYSIQWTNQKTVLDIDKKTKICYTLEFNLGVLIPNLESQYLSTLYDVIITGEKRQTRNAITLSKFNKTISCDLSNGFPLLTTKKMFWKGIVEELLFFIRGDTDTTKLSSQGVKIWEANTSREFLNSQELTYPEGHMGPMYGYQWRYWGKPYTINEKSDLNKKGIDQLSKIISEIKSDPNSRRLLITDFNPEQVSEGVLYPCHSIIIQFYIQDKKLSCTMYQRSGDLFLGIPFNIASTSLLVHILSKLTGLNPGTVNLVIGDYHIYDAHISAAYEQFKRIPKDFPKIVIPDFTTIEQVEQSKFSDYMLIDYVSDSIINGQMIP